jgi:hypothetical protein
VLVSTAGPFLKVGRSVVEAAVDAGAVYLDSTGEPPFIRQVFEEFGPRAEHTGAVLLTAFGYEAPFRVEVLRWIPGSRRTRLSPGRSPSPSPAPASVCPVSSPGRIRAAGQSGAAGQDGLVCSVCVAS